MLTKEDIKLLTEFQESVFVTKFEFNERFDRLETDLRELKSAIDGLAKMVKDFRDEHVIIHKRLEVLEEWAKQVSKKLGISLPF